MRRLLSVLLPAVGLLGLAAPGASARTVTYHFEGVVDTSLGASTGIFAFAVDGTLVSGTISFDDRLLDRINGIQQDEFYNFTPVQNQAYSTAYQATMTIGALSLSQVATEAYLPQALLQLTDQPAGGSNPDTVIYQFIRTGPTVPGNDEFRLAFFDSSASAIGAPGYALNGLIGGAIDVLDHLDVSDYNAVTRSYWQARDGTDQITGVVSFNATSFTRVKTVPVPTAALLLASALLGLVGAASLAPARRR